MHVQWYIYRSIMVDFDGNFHLNMPFACMDPSWVTLPNKNSSSLKMVGFLKTAYFQGHLFRGGLLTIVCFLPTVSRHSLRGRESRTRNSSGRQFFFPISEVRSDQLTLVV